MARSHWRPAIDGVWEQEGHAVRAVRLAAEGANVVVSNVYRQSRAERSEVSGTLTLQAAQELARRVRWKPCAAAEVRRARLDDQREGRSALRGGKMWTVDRVVDMARPASRRGRQLSVKLRWKGCWGELQSSWVEVSWLNARTRREARELEAERYPAVRVLGKRRADDGVAGGSEAARGKTPRLAGELPGRGLR